MSSEFQNWRYVIVGLLHSFWFMMFSQRFSMSISIVSMIKTNATAVFQHTNDTTTVNKTVDSSQDSYRFDWTNLDIGNVLASFFYGYTLTQLLGGYISSRHGSKTMLSIAMLISTLATFITPFMAFTSFGVLIATRSLLGVMQGLMFPSLFSVFSKWVPKSETTMLMSLFMSAEQTTVLFTAPVGAGLSHSHFLGGWPVLYYLMTFLTLGNLVVWHLLVTNTPEEHRFISKTECDMISRDRESEGVVSWKQVPWRMLFTSRASIAIFVGQWGYVWIWITLFTSLPLFYKNAYGVALMENSLFTALPYVCVLFFSNAVAYGVNSLLKRRMMSVTVARKLVYVVSVCTSAVCLIAATFFDNDSMVYVVIVICIGNSFIECNRAGVFANMVDVSPNFCGILCGISQTLSCVAMFLQPITASYFISSRGSLDDIKKEYRNFFYLCSGIAFFCSIVFVSSASGQQQDWDGNDEEVQPLVA